MPFLNQIIVTNCELKINYKQDCYDFIRRNNVKCIINVDDSPRHLFDPVLQEIGVSYHWFPVKECGFWGWTPFYAAAKVYDFYKNSESRIIIHCAAGVNRSRCIAYALLLSEGYSVDLVEGYLGVKSLWEHNIKKGFIPENIIEFLKMRFNYPTYAVSGLLNMVDPENKTDWFNK